MVQGVERRAETRPAMALQEGKVLPFGKVRKSFKCLFDGFGQHLWRQSLGQRIDRLDQRHAIEFIRRDDVVRVGHLRFVVEPFDLAGDEPRFTFRQRPADRVRIGMEEHECQRPRAIRNVNPVGNPLVAGWWRAVAHHCRLHCHDTFAWQAVDPGPEAPVDDAGGQVEQQVDDARRVAGRAMGRAQERGEQLVQLGADTL